MGLRADWSRIGIVNIAGDEVDSSAMQAIAHELLQQKAKIREAIPHRDGVTVSRDCVIDSPQKCTYAGAGPELTDFSNSLDLISLLSEITGIRQLVPIRKGYKYYRSGDYIGVHTDRQGCDVTITMTFDDAAEGIVYWPSLRAASRDSLVDAFEGPVVLPDGGVSMPLHSGVLNIFAGHELPHARPVHGPGETSIATICYLSLPD